MSSTRTITQSGSRRSTRAKGAPYLFLVLRCDQPIAPGARFLLHDVDVVTLGRAPSLEVDRYKEGAVTVMRIGVPDARMSGRHARIQRVLGTWALADEGSKNGTFLGGDRVTSVALGDGGLLELGQTFFLFRDTLPAAEPAFLDGRNLSLRTRGLATLSPALGAELANVAAYARSRMPVLIRGESGTGKELIARAIHELSGRPGAFVPVNCGAIAPNLLESELFGHRKGAFTGADEDRAGLIQSSDRGTLLLDEIGDLPPPAQAALLRVLQEQEVQPVGATRATPIDLRVVAATHRDLFDLAGRDRFRADLLARLDGAHIVLPPLRSRREDLGLIVASLLRKIGGDDAQRISLTVDAARALLTYGWPRNVRELENCLLRALALAANGRIELAHLRESVRTGVAAAPLATALRDDDRKLRDELLQLLREHNGNVTAVARAMNKARTQVQRWMRRFDLRAESFLR